MMSSENKRIRTAFFIPSFKPLPYGGAESQAFLLAKYLIKNNFDVFIITQGKKGIDTFEIVEGVEIYRLPSLSFFENLRRRDDSNTSFAISKIKDFSGKTYVDNNITFKTFLGQFIIFLKLSFFYFRNFRKLNFKIIYLPTIFEFALPLFLFARLFFKKLVIKDSTADGIIVMPNSVFPNYTRKLITRNNYFVAMTQTILENYYKAGINSKQIFQIPNGIEILNFNREIEWKGTRCLFVGNLTQQPAKGVDVLLKSWIRVISSVPDAHLFIVGRGDIDAYKIYVNSIGISNSVTFVGSVDPTTFYLSSDLFILPSRREGMSNALMEAMLYELPVIATDISGSKDLIENGKSGIIVPTEEITLLSDKIIYMLKHPDLAQEMGKQARRSVIEKCNIEKVAKDYKSLFTSIINKN